MRLTCGGHAIPILLAELPHWPPSGAADVRPRRGRLCGLRPAGFKVATKLSTSSGDTHQLGRDANSGARVEITTAPEWRSKTLNARVADRVEVPSGVVIHRVIYLVSDVLDSFAALSNRLLGRNAMSSVL